MKKAFVSFLFAVYLCVFAPFVYAGEIADDFPGEYYKNTGLEKHTVKNYDFEKIDNIPVKIKAVKSFSTREYLKEGDSVYFKTLYRVKSKDWEIPPGTILKARIETVSNRGLKGVPSDLIVGSFYAPEFKDLNFDGMITKKGANRSIWVCPLMAFGTVFFGAGSFFGFIQGGHAKISKDETFEISILE